MRRIVSLTSFGRRINTTLPQTLDSIQKQTDFEADEIVLYLTADDSRCISKSLFKDIKNLTVKIAPDYKSYKKYLALADRTYDDDLVWVVDDDSLYCDYDYSSFVKAYEKSGDENAVYAFNAWQLKNYSDNFYPNKITTGGKIKGAFVIGDNKLYPPRVMRFDEAFVKTAFEVSPTCDDTFLSAYLQKCEIPVYLVKPPKGKTETYVQLEVPRGGRKLIDINRLIIGSNLKRNFGYFGLL